MRVEGQEGHEREAPKVLRKVPPERTRLARAMTYPGIDASGGTWWELVDPVADAELPAEAVAFIQKGAGSSVVVSALGVRHSAGEDVYCELLRALVAAFRSAAADTVIIRESDLVVVGALLEVGFTRAPGVDESDRYVIAL
jgi:hypothetical protein